MGKLADLTGVVIPVAIRVPALTITEDADKAIFYAKEKYKIISAGFVPDTAYTGADTDTRNFGLVNKGTAGAGSTAMHTAIDLVNGVVWAAMDYKELVAEADGKTLAAGEVVSIVSTHAGNGIVFPAGTFMFYLKPVNL